MWVGQEIGGRFVPEREVAAGGFGRIFQARDEHTGGKVALKVISAFGGHSVERFAREATVLARIRHPHIVRYVAHGRTEDGSPYLAMEWLEGEDLAQRLARSAAEGSATWRSDQGPDDSSRSGTLRVDEVLLLGRRVASALAELHRVGIVHRDIKPSNIFLVDGGIDGVKVLDFGTARSVAGAHDITPTGVVVGTPSYMAPEQVTADRDVGAAADVWALGCVLYRCLTGVAPFTGTHVAALMAKILVEEQNPVGELRPEAPPALAALVGRMLAKDPSRRPADGGAVLAEIEGLEETEEIGSRDDFDGAPKTERQRRSLTSLENRIRPVETARTLLGKPTRWVGRRHDLALLRALYDGCVEESRARAVVLTAPEGMGKSRLAHELLRSIEEASPRPEVLRGQGDSLSAGSPFVMLASALRRAAGLRDGEPIEARRSKLRERIARSLPGASLDRVTALLGEMVGVRFPEKRDSVLREARKDAMLLGDAMRAAFEELLRAECEAAPVVLLLEDLHWGDLPSIKFVDAALRSLHDRPLLVLALARPEVHATFPGLFADREVQNLQLSPLSPKASAELLRGALGEGADPGLVDRLVRQGGGNAFFLEELARAVAAGAPGALPPTVLGAVGARLDALGPEAKRILRAASVLGEVFWRGGVGALVGADDGARVDAWLDHLVAREVIARRPEARVPGEREYAFCHALVREAAYAMLTADDRRLGHRLAGAWLEQAGAVDALTLAEHFVRGDDPARAVRWFLRAADQALEGNDLGAAAQSAERAAAAGAAGEDLGQARFLEATALFWQSAYADARRRSEEAAALLPRGSADFFRALGTAIVASAVLGGTSEVDQRLSEVAGIEPAPGGESDQLVALSRGCFQLIFAGRFDVADAILARITQRAAPLLDASLGPASSRFDAMAVAQVHHVIGLREAHRGYLGTLIQHLEAALPAFERAFDRRNVLVETTSLGACYAELGDFERGERIVRDNLAACERAGAARATTYARGYLGGILVHRPGTLDEARRLLEQVIEEHRAANNGRYEGLLRTDLAIALHLAGDLAGSEAEAQRASDLLAAGLGFRARALAVLARARLGLGRAAEALAAAREAQGILDRLGGLITGESLPPLALAEALFATGDAAGAEAAARDAKERLHRRAARIADPHLRETFLAHPDSARTLALSGPPNCT
jgi:serine/threonine protein kinase/tetratricopeptide (TPR) repeat protein